MVSTVHLFLFCGGVNMTFYDVFVRVFVYVVIFVLLGCIPSSIAARMNRNPTLWWVYGFFLFPVALIHAMLLRRPPVPTQSVPMKWYHFLKVFLWFFAVVNIILAVVYLKGWIYQTSNYTADYVYERLPILRFVDYMKCGMCLITTALALRAWFKLRHFQKNAPRSVNTLFGINGLFLLISCLAVLYIVATQNNETYIVNQMVDGNLIETTVIEEKLIIFQPSELVFIIFNLIMMKVNAQYFQKRASLFNN